MCRRDTLRLALLDVFALQLRHVAQDLKDQIRHERSRDAIGLLACIEQRHIKHHDGSTLIHRDASPFIEDFSIISTQTINTFDHENVALAQSAKKTLVLGTLKVLTTCLVSKNLTPLNGKPSQCVQLAVQVLVRGRDTRIPKDSIVHNCPYRPPLGSISSSESPLTIGRANFANGLRSFWRSATSYSSAVPTTRWLLSVINCF